MSDIISILKKRAKQLGTKPAYLFLKDGEKETSRISFQQLEKTARTIATYLQRKTLTGQRVLLIFPSGIEFICSFLGCLYAGVIAIPIYCNRSEDLEKNSGFIKNAAKHARISGVLVAGIFFNDLRENQTDLFIDPNIFLENYDNIDLEDSAEYQLPILHSDTIAYLQYTSGSTNSPKAVMIQHQNLFHNLKFTGETWQFNKNSTSFTFAPHGNVYGLVCGLLMPLFQGGLAIFMPPEAFIKKPVLWLKAITQYKVTHSGCPNFGYTHCISHVDEFSQELNLRSWKVAVNGGDIVRNNTMIDFAKKFKPFGFSIKQFSPAYGMSEMAGTIAVHKVGKKPFPLCLARDALTNNKVVRVNKKQPHYKCLSNGRLLPGYKAIIIDPTTLVPITNHIGEICLAGKYVMAGYWQFSEDEDSPFIIVPGSKEKYFRTGDLGFLYKKEIFITGRLKEIIVKYGKKYNPSDIEHTIDKVLNNVSPGRCVVFSVLSQSNEEIIVLQEQTKNLQLQSTDVATAIRESVLKNHGLEIKQVYFVAENSLPLTKSGKLQRVVAKQQFENGIIKISQESTAILINNQQVDFNKTLKNKFITEYKKVIADIFKIKSDAIESSPT